MNRDIRVSVLLFQQNKLLVVNMKRKNSNIHVLPGGGLEKGESIFEAGIREVKEETNLKISISKIAYIKELYNDTIEAIDIILLGEIIDGNLQKGHDPEHEKDQVLHKVKWIEVEKLSLLDFHPKQLIEQLPEDLKNKFSSDIIHLGRYNYPE
ncbi:MAG: NUDIX hydrolase [Nanoarchaeota archaeon]|nr:NUDIX hydrolase [Nanoarchaeota archaeon]MBU1321399.1 NUDIX hydrolase [Nanoarchaeota archaeon]MBU1597817.1 NUDIX hydrolase [Nanoarchaeota archaeon]MBU2441921.1 NUDIX hydrolase [Nanoarchaeota archaeon]